ncbi:MAG TPA: hypothetical protein VHG09_06695 [Longimicrobiales bacterium]|nr:hypothetical protein [Longimicrobiales bacterium]
MRMTQPGLAAAAVTIAVAIAAGCAEAGPRDDPEADWSAVPALAADSIASFGGSSAEGSHALARVTGVVMSGGEPAMLAVANASSAEVRIFDVSGAHVRSVGGEGEGPGEFRWIDGLWRIRDGIVVWDNSLDRLTILRHDGSIDVARIEVPLPPGREFSLVGAFDDGSPVIRTRRSEMHMRGARPGSYTDTLTYARLDAATLRMDTLVRVVTAPSRFHDSGSSWGFEERIFGSEVHATVGDEALFVGSGDDHTIEAFTMDGRDDPPRIVTLPPSSRPLTTALVPAERERRLAAIEERSAGLMVRSRDGSNTTGEVVHSVSDVVASLPASTLTPVFDRLLAEGDSVLWLRERPLQDVAQAVWLRLNLRTGEAARLMLPPTEDIVAARSPYFIIRMSDDLDAPVLIINRLRDDG